MFIHTLLTNSLRTCCLYNVEKMFFIFFDLFKAAEANPKSTEVNFKTVCIL